MWGPYAKYYVSISKRRNPPDDLRGGPLIRLAIQLLAGGILLALIATSVDLRSDAGSILGTNPEDLSSLDSAAGRELIIALAARDLTVRNSAARDIAAMLKDDPLVQAVQSGPVEFSETFLDWVW